MRIKKYALYTFIALLGGTNALNAQKLYTPNPYVKIDVTDTQADIVKKAAQVTPTERQLKWQQLELNAFIHFGINTFTNREWGDGTESPELFNPTALDAKQWAKVCKEAGFKQIILTAKHHDGFCLWPTKTTEHSVKNSPWKNGKGDVVKEFANACKEYGLGFGIYLSPWDRNSPLYGDEKYNDLFIEQLTELLTKYGKVDEVWFDGANGEGPNGKKQVYDYERWYALIRKIQPQAVIAVMGSDVRWVGTETGYGRETEWSVVPTNQTLPENIAGDSQQSETVKPVINGKAQDIGSRDKIKDAKSLVWYPAEADVSIRPGWFYHDAENNKVKSPEKLLDIYYNSVGRNSVLLLNVPPDKRGLIHQSDIDALQGWKKLIDSTFSTNLLKNARIKSKNGKNKSGLIDGKYNTYWTTRANDSTSVIDFKLDGKKTFDVFSIQENIRIGQRIEKFILEYQDGETWKKITEGTTVGYKRLLKFTPITADKIRLRIIASRLNPTIAEAGLYKSPK